MKQKNSSSSNKYDLHIILTWFSQLCLLDFEFLTSLCLERPSSDDHFMLLSTETDWLLSWIDIISIYNLLIATNNSLSCASAFRFLHSFPIPCLPCLPVSTYCFPPRWLPNHPHLCFINSSPVCVYIPLTHLSFALLSSWYVPSVLQIFRLLDSFLTLMSL